MHVLARRWRPRGVTPVRLLDSRSEPLQAVATSLWQSRPNHARPNTSSPGDQACRKDRPFWCDSADEAVRDSFVPISLCGHMLQPAHTCRIIVAFFAERVGRLSATLEIPVKSTPPRTVALSAEVIPLRQ